MPRYSSRRSRTRSRSRDRRRSSSRTRRYDDRDRDRDRSYKSSRYDRNRSSSRDRYSDRKDEPYRLHVSNLTEKAYKEDIEETFRKYGELNEVWVAKNPPCFAFVVFKRKEDADEAVRDLDGKQFCGSRVRVTWAHPRSKGRRRHGFDPNLRCYQCGEKGHFSRDCEREGGGKKRSGGDNDRNGSNGRRYSRYG